MARNGTEQDDVKTFFSRGPRTSQGERANPGRSSATQPTYSRSLRVLNPIPKPGKIVL